VRISFEYLAEAIFRDDRKRLNDFNRHDFLAPFVTCNGMPADVRIVDIVTNPIAAHGACQIILESAEWPDQTPYADWGYHLTSVSFDQRVYTSYATYLAMEKEKADVASVFVVDNK
jgi:hypothetical protein